MACAISVGVSIESKLSGFASAEAERSCICPFLNIRRDRLATFLSSAVSVKTSRRLRFQGTAQYQALVVESAVLSVSPDQVADIWWAASMAHATTRPSDAAAAAFADMDRAAVYFESRLFFGSAEEDG